MVIIVKCVNLCITCRRAFHVFRNSQGVGEHLVAFMTLTQRKQCQV